MAECGGKSSARRQSALLFNAGGGAIWTAPCLLSLHNSLIDGVNNRL
jgi:hypothetical protein